MCLYLKFNLLSHLFSFLQIQHSFVLHTLVCYYYLYLKFNLLSHFFFLAQHYHSSLHYPLPESLNITVLKSLNVHDTLEPYCF